MLTWHFQRVGSTFLKVVARCAQHQSFQHMRCVGKGIISLANSMVTLSQKLI